MPSQSEVFDTPQTLRPVVNEFWQDAFYKDTIGYDDQPIRVEPRKTQLITRTEPGYLVLPYVYDHLQPKEDFTEQRRTLNQHYTVLGDDHIITRLLEAKLNPPIRGFLNYFAHPVILEIYELAENTSDDEYEERTAARSKSVSYAVIFANNILDKCKTRPEVDLHPDGEVSLTWRSNTGIINIAFGEYGTATYAAYFSLHKETHKGRFSVSSVISETIMHIIDRIENSNGRQC